MTHQLYDLEGKHLDEFVHSWHANTRLPDGRPALLIDRGSVGNLCGDRWAKTVADAAKRQGLKPVATKRDRPLNVKGVGTGGQACEYDSSLPIALRNTDGKLAISGKLVTPTISKSDIPGLLGLSSLRKNRAILDMNTLQLHFLGPGDYNLHQSLPPGTESFQLETAPSGHLVLPCAEFSADAHQSDPSNLTLLAREEASSSSGPPRARVALELEQLVPGPPGLPLPYQ